MFKNCFKVSIEDWLEEQKLSIEANEARERKHHIITHETPASRMASIVMMTIHNVKQTP